MKTQTLNFDNCSIQELIRAANAYHREHICSGGTSEFDMTINDISRAKIKALKKEQGSCFMYKLNKWKQSDPDVWEYNGEKIYNFSCSFVTAKLDHDLAEMVMEYNRPKGEGEKYDPKKIYSDIEAIFARVEIIGGLITTWA